VLAGQRHQPVDLAVAQAMLVQGLRGVCGLARVAAKALTL
jgi:hypothetical protein